MPSSPAAKKLLLVFGLVIAVLALVGLVGGGIGAAALGNSPLISRPEIHLPPQPVFPRAIREEHLGFLPAGGHDQVPAGESSERSSGGTGVAPAGASEEAEELHSTPLGATEFAITNTMLSAWFASAVLILLFALGARKASMIPGRLQSLVEVLFEGVLSFASGVLGPEMARKTFPIVATIFFFVLFNAWLALLPFYQFLGFVDADGEIKAHLLRPAGTDLNMPLALALISFVFVEYWGFRSNGFGYLKKFFAFGSLIRKGPIQGGIDVAVGLLELLSEGVRIVAFTFRLFGNLTAGEILVVMITFLFPLVFTNLVYGLELLVGLIQAVIFAGLTLVFISVATSHQEH